MRVFLTGATGFIGSHVARALVERGAEVHALVRPSSSPHRLQGLEDRVTLVHGDLEQHEALMESVDAISPDVCIHLAWYMEPERCLRAIPENLANLADSTRLLRSLLAAGTSRIVLGGSWIEAAWDPRTPGASPRQTIYGAAKFGLHVVGEQLSQMGASVVCAHLFHVYGPWENERRVVPTVIGSLLRGEEVAVTAGEQQRDYLHTADVASALCTVAESDLTGTVDVCSGSNVTLLDLFRLIGEETGRSELIRVGERPYGPDEAFAAFGDARSLQSLGWGPSFGLREGVRDTVAWWAEHLDLSAHRPPPAGGQEAGS